MPEPRSYREVIEKGISRALFIEKQELKAVKRKPVRTKATPIGTLYAMRNKRLVIREAALRKVQVILHYRKITTGEHKTYIVAPYEWKYRKLKIGLRKVLYAYDMKDKHIKSFVQINITRAILTDRKFKPKWTIRIY